MAVRIKKTAVIHCSGGCAFQNGVRLCPDGCTACGACVSACRKQAVIPGDSTGKAARIDREKCVGCGLCVRACPQGIITLEPADSRIEPLCSLRKGGAEARKICGSSCISCRICEKNCPAGAFAVTGDIPRIDPEKCISCGMCAVKCPRGVIGDVDRILGRSF